MIRVLSAQAPRSEPQRGSASISAPATIRSTAARSQAKVAIILLLSAGQEVDLDDPRTIAGMNAMVGAELLSAERVGEVLN
jgi:hypothetical protein